MTAPHPFHGEARITLSPHIGGVTADAYVKMGVAAAAERACRAERLTSGDMAMKSRHPPMESEVPIGGGVGAIPRRVQRSREIDWVAIERDYRSGSFSLRELAERHRCSHSAIANFAGRHGWMRNCARGDSSAR